MAHEKFDRLAGVRPEDRSRSDRLPKRIINELVRWLDESGADETVKWSHTLLAHAAGPNLPNRSAIAAAVPTADKITGCIRAFVQVAEAAPAPQKITFFGCAMARRLMISRELLLRTHGCHCICQFLSLVAFC